MKIDPQKKDGLWKFYFIMGGFICLIYWNSIINLAEYFIKTIGDKGFTLMAFSFTFGSIISFFISPVVFSKLPHKFGLNTGVIGSVMFFFLTLYACEATEDFSLNQSLAVGSSFIFGFFSSFMQTKITGMAADISNQEVVYFNFGTGVAGIASNIFCFAITMVYPVLYDDSDISVLRQQVLAYVSVVTLLFIIFFAVQHAFDQRNPEILLFEGDKEIENILTEGSMVDTERSLGEITIVKKALDLLISLTLLYVCTIVVLTYFNIKAYFAFDRSKSYITIPIYTFFFNLFDTIGKFLPPQSVTRNVKLVHALNVARIALPIYFYFILHYPDTYELAWSSYRVLANILLGFTNGYFTNCLITMATKRFSKILEKAKVAYFSIIFLYIGIVLGTFGTVLMTPD